MKKQRAFSLAALAVLLASALSSAEVPSPAGFVADAASAAADAIIGAILDFLLQVFKQLGEWVFGWIGTAVAAILNILIGVYKVMILWNPNPYAVAPLMEGLMQVMIPAYVLLITLVGMYFLFVSGSPVGRARAKETFLKLIFGMILVSLSLELYQVLLDISYAISLEVLSGAYFEANTTLGALGAAIVVTGGWMIPVTFLFILIFAGISIGIRHFLVFLMAAIFPLTLFLYFFDFTKGIGGKLMRYTTIAIFTQVVQAYILAVTILSVNAAAEAPTWFSKFLCLFISMGGFSLLVLAPLILLGIMQWIGTALAMVGSVLSFVPGWQLAGGVLTAVGSVAAGMGPGGLIAGGTAYGLGTAYTNTLAKIPPRRKPSFSETRSKGLNERDKVKQENKRERKVWRDVGKTDEEIFDEEQRTQYDEYYTEDAGAGLLNMEETYSNKPPESKPAKIQPTEPGVGTSLKKRFGDTRAWKAGQEFRQEGSDARRGASLLNKKAGDRLDEFLLGDKIVKDDDY